MDNKISAIQIFNLMIKPGADELTASAEAAESFEMLFPEKDMMGTILAANIKNFLENLLRFIITRSKIVVDADKAKASVDEMQEITMPLCLDQDNNCILGVSALKEAFEVFKSRYDEKEREKLDIFWEFLLYEIHDFEEELSHDINGFWEMKENGIDVQVVKVE